MSDETSPLLDSLTKRYDDTEAEVYHGKGEKPRPTFDWIFFLIAQLGILLALADDSFVLSTHSEIASYFGQMSVSHWLVTGYNLGYSVALPAYGRLYSIFGAKTMLITAYLMFAVGCTTTGTSVSMWMAVLGRILAGIGGAGMVDLISVLITDMVSLKQVALLRSYIGMVTTIGNASGAPIGGLITSLVGWRWSFLGQVPFVLLCLVMAAYKLPSRSRPEHQVTDTEYEGSSSQQLELDLPGICLLGGAISSFILLCHSVGEQSSPVTWILVATLLISSVSFVAHEMLWAKDPLIPFKVMATSDIGIPCITQTLIMFSMFGLLSNIAEFFVRTEYISTGIVGLFLMPIAFGSAVGALVCGYFIQRTGKYKSIAIASLGVSLINLVLIAIRWPSGPSHWELVYALFASGGIGGLLSSTFVGLSASTPKEHSATVITTYYLAQQIGMILGVTTAATICRTLFQNDLLRKLGTDSKTLQVIQQVLSHTRFAQSLPKPLQSSVISSYLESFRVVPVSSLCSIALVLSLLLPLREKPLQ